MKTASEIKRAIERLSHEEQLAIADWLNVRLFPETPQTLAARDAGIHSLETKPAWPAEEVRRKIPEWAAG